MARFLILSAVICACTAQERQALVEDGRSLVPDSGVHVRSCVDSDGDSYGRECVLGPDCDDHDATVHPGAIEFCDETDNGLR